MRVLLDTNVIIDVLAKREPFYRDALMVLRYSEMGRITGIITASCVTDIMYILRKYLQTPQLRKSVQSLVSILDVCDVTKEDILQAFASEMADYEDALQAQCASKSDTQYVITRNTKDFANSPIKAIEPHKFLALLNS